MEVAARKTEGRGRGGGAGKAPSQQSAEPKPSIRQRTVHAIPLPGKQEGRSGHARLSGRRWSPGGTPRWEEASGCACLCVRGHRGQQHPPRPGHLPEGRAAVDSECSPRPGPRDGHFLSSLGQGCQAFPDLPNTNPLWEEKLSRERDRHGNRTELARLLWRGERCLVQRPQCEFPSLPGMLLVGISPSRSCSCTVRPGRSGPGKLP